MDVLTLHPYRRVTTVIYAVLAAVIAVAAAADHRWWSMALAAVVAFVFASAWWDHVDFELDDHTLVVTWNQRRGPVAIDRAAIVGVYADRRQTWDRLSIVSRAADGSFDDLRIPWGGGSQYAPIRNARLDDAVEQVRALLGVTAALPRR
jgi:hypothetical protein